MSTAAALVVCRDATERATYADWFRVDGYHVTEADSSTAAITAHQRQFFPVTLAELAAPVIDGAQLIHAVRCINPEAEVWALSRGDSVSAAVAAMKAGARDLLLKPIAPQMLRASIGAISLLSVCRLLPEHQRLREELYRRYDFEQIVAHSPEMLRVLALAGRVAACHTTVLITGESGTGKELLARAIHLNGPRARRSLVSINCAAIPEPLLESELFGFKRGAFTGAHADKPGLLSTASGGTLFLDEVAELPLTTQAKLLRFLQEGTYFPLGSVQPVRNDVRVMAATNAALAERVQAGVFRQDLYYRLSAFPLHIPPLSKRIDDIVPLASHFLRQLERQIGKRVPGLSREAAAYVTTRPWRGNVRELQNAIERAVIVSEGNLLTSADFRCLDAEPGSGRGDAVSQLPEHGVDLPALNRELIRAALERTCHNVSAAARLLGLTRPALRYRMRK